MIKHIAIIFFLMLILMSIGTVGLYKLVGTYSGQDAMCLSGIVAGIVVGLWYGKSQGLGVVFPINLSAVAISAPLVVLSLVFSHSGQDLVESLAYFSVGFSLLFFFIVGLGWGKHLTRVAN
ncbi:hypothetical protein [Teredinibacter purpureus]|uniref:hypothetical protein n=1 Tax=Teredinibacter purpureus TaxID=2731756 RepID=UPI000697B254|nr:hypothetical protein [Teredinibacter purpureus]